jgi:hypothetical protein
VFCLRDISDWQRLSWYDFGDTFIDEGNLEHAKGKYGYGYVEKEDH